MPFLKRADLEMRKKVFVTVPLMKRVISMKMEKRFLELLFQIINSALGRVTCRETWNHSQIMNVAMMIMVRLMIMII